ncbi:acylneuraminate cytidylyltransferase [Chelonobacter oris]|uniref:cytidylyltransferase domain-containing protein n=1 Tax=Chelonobacter oris TaxID=505317 RepID=UPI0024485E1E|nr:GDSL-type esterase/lipase family protein [Chelonobacter oris]MDH3000861.1 acylneuraminate cytidylyltransferase [Chelonobacter oris]
MKKIAIITARSGSKGLANKNVLLVNGKPLLAYSIEAAIESDLFDKIILSTDSQEYIDLLSHYPIEFIKRSKELATDTTSSFVVIEDILKQYQTYPFDYFVLLQPTSPLRKAFHIQESCRKFENNFDKFDFLVSVSDAHKPTTLTRMIDTDESLKNFKLDYSNYTRQQYFREYSPNGAIFSAKPEAYLKQKHFYGERCIAYFMSKSVSIDIDDKLDFEYFYFLIQQQNRETKLLNDIIHRITCKKKQFQNIRDITFIGDSILDHWSIKKLVGKKVGNLAISEITVREYLELVLKKKMVTSLGKIVILMIGLSDLANKKYSIESIFLDIKIVIKLLKKIRPDVDIYFLEIIPTALRADINNNDIRKLNKILAYGLKEIKWIDLDKQFSDKYQKLDLAYSNDGLHLNDNGYRLLDNILHRELTK